MIYQFKGSCKDSVDFRIDIEVDANQTFYDLHLILQSALGFHPGQPATFLIPGYQGHHPVEITQFIPGNKRSRLFTMNSTLIGDIIKTPLKFIRYYFDFLNDRFINMQLTGTNMEKNLREPAIILNKGEVPVQTMDEILTGELFDMPDGRTSDPNYGMLDDYYGIFGEMEEYVL